MSNEKNSFQEFVRCNLCHADDYDVLFEAGVAQIARIVRCRHCSLMYANPRAQLADHANYERHDPIGLLAGVTEDRGHPYRWRFEKESLQVRDYEDSLGRLAALHPARGHVVEVGSSLGYLLKRFQEDGWTVQGIDPWAEVCAHTRDVHGFETTPTTLEGAALPDASADVVIMLHVIEHVPDPLASLREVRRVLKPGGHVVIETPRYDTVMFKLMGKRERSLRQDGHIYFFTSGTLRECLREAGFGEVEMRYTGRSLTADRLMWNLGNATRSETLRDAIDRTSKALGFQNIRLTLNLRDMMRAIIARD